MKNINVKLYQACIAHTLNLTQIAWAAGIENSRFSKILHEKLKAGTEERRRLSKLLGKPQKKLFGKEVERAR